MLANILEIYIGIPNIPRRILLKRLNGSLLVPFPVKLNFTANDGSRILPRIFLTVVFTVFSPMPLNRLPGIN